MNKYVLKIPYSYLRFGTYSCNVFADTEEDALDMAGEFENHFSDDYDDNENDGDMDFDYSDTDIELEEEDVDDPVNITNDSNSEKSPFSKTPDYFLAELLQL